MLPWAAVAAVASAVAVWLAFSVSLNPPGLHPREVVFSVAQAEVVIDSPTFGLGYDGAVPYRSTDFQVQTRSESLTLAGWLQSQGALQRMADAAGIPGQLVATSGPYSVTLDENSPPLLRINKNYRLLVDINGNQPMISLYGQAPTERAAVAIVDSARSQLIQYLATEQAAYYTAQRAAGHPRGQFEPFVIRPLGSTVGGVVDPGATERVMGVAFAVVFLMGSGVVMLVRGARKNRRRITHALRDRPDARRDDDTDLWPHTRRFLPWMMAVFLGMIYLVPIDAIFGGSGSSIGLAPTVDRILLIPLGIGWLISLRRRGGGFARPQIRFTRIHVVMILFVGVAFLSVAVNAPYLTVTQQMMPSVKKLPVLATFVIFFVIAASVIRPGEVRPLLKLVVILGVLCSLGTLVERQTHWNVFYAIWTTLHVPVAKPPEMDVLDDIGRLGVVGPTSQPLELATLLSMVIPPAIMFAFESKTRRERILWLLALGIILGGAMATSRKTSIVAPLCGVIVLIIYRPRMMLRGLLIASVPLFLLVHVAAPGQLGSVISELEPSHATAVNTDKVRVRRYDAVRPDVLSHVLLGNGYSSYDPIKFQYTDNEYLNLLITTGVLGMMGLLAIFWVLLTVSHPLARAPDKYRSNPALALHAMVVMVMVCSALFDSISFGHVSYMLFMMSAMLVAMQKPSLRALQASRTARAGGATDWPGGELSSVRRPLRRGGASFGQEKYADQFLPA